VETGAGLLPQPATSALISETDREIDLEITGLETVPQIHAEQGDHDLLQVQPRADPTEFLNGASLELSPAAECGR